MFKHKETPSPSSVFSLCWFTTVWSQPALEACLHGDKGRKESDDVAGRTAVPNQPCVTMCVCVWMCGIQETNRQIRFFFLFKRRVILLSSTTCQGGFFSVAFRGSWCFKSEVKDKQLVLISNAMLRCDWQYRLWQAESATNFIWHRYSHIFRL